MGRASDRRTPGSVLGPLLFNVYINDMFYMIEHTELCNFADDTTPYSCHHNLQVAMTNVEHDCAILVEWFCDNFMTLNTEKCHLLVSGIKDELMFAKVGDATIWEECVAKLLGILIDSDLTFNDHVKMTCKKASQKLSAISRMADIISIEKRKTLLSAFFESQFSYCPLIWMFCSRKLNTRINRIHERALRIAYNDYTSSFEQLLIKDNSSTIHKRNLRALATEMYKISHDLSPPFMRELFIEKTGNYNTRSTYVVDIDKSNEIHCTKKLNFGIPKAKTTHFGLESIRRMGPIIWGLVSEDMKNAKSIEIFKEEVKKLDFEKCPCKICKEYVQGVGYID